MLRRMADESSDLGTRREAWGQFYERHARYVQRVCSRAHSQRIGHDRVPDAVSDTFLRAYEKAATFNFCEASRDEQARAVRGWLARINENIVHDYFRNAPTVDYTDEPKEVVWETTSASTDVPPEDAPDGDAKLVEEGLNTLTEREQRVLRETVFWYVDGARQQRMPHAAMERLAADLGTTPSNIRQIRTRALSKLRQYVLDRS